MSIGEPWHRFLYHKESMLLVRQQVLDKAKEQDLFNFQNWTDDLKSGTLPSQKRKLLVNAFPYCCTLQGIIQKYLENSEVILCFEIM